MRSKFEVESCITAAEAELKQREIAYGRQHERVEALKDELFLSTYLDQARAGQQLQTPVSTGIRKMAKGCVALAILLDMPVTFKFNHYVITVYPNTDPAMLHINRWQSQLPLTELAEEAAERLKDAVFTDELQEGHYKVRDTLTHPE